VLGEFPAQSEYSVFEALKPAEPGNCSHLVVINLLIGSVLRSQDVDRAP
jgi:hypothetical protein